MFDESQAGALTDASGDLSPAPLDTSQVSRQLPATAQDSAPPKQVSQQFPAEPFIPSRADRPHNQWAQPDFALQGAMNYPGYYRGPLMPQMHDIAGLIHGAVMGLGRFGSRYTGMPAIAMGTYASAYWNAYQKGMNQRAGQAYQQYRQARQMTIDRGKEEMLEYAKIYAAYYVDGKITDVHGFEQALLQAAKQYQNHSIINAIESGNVGAAERIIQATDSHVMNLIKAQHQEERQKSIDEERKQLIRLRNEQERRRQQQEKEKEEQRKRIEEERRRIDPNAKPLPSDTAGSVENDIIPPVATPDTSDSDTSDSDTPDSDTSDSDTVPNITDTESNAPPGKKSQKPVQVADASGSVLIGEEGGPSPSATKTKSGLEPEGNQETPFLERAARDWVFSNKLPAALDKKTMPDFIQRAEQRGQGLRDWLDRLESDPNVKPSDIVPAVRKYFPVLADRIQGYLDGKLTPTGQTKDLIWQRAVAIAERIDPTFSQGTFASRQKAMQYWTNGEGGKTLTSNGQVLSHMKDLIAILKDKPYMFTGWLDTMTGIEGYKAPEFENLINTINSEYARALSGKGGTIPELKEQSRELSINMPEGAIRANIDSKIRAIKVRLDQLKDAFTSTTGWPGKQILERFDKYAQTAKKATNADREAAKALKDLDSNKSAATFTGRTARNPKTGETLRETDDGQWVK